MPKPLTIDDLVLIQTKVWSARQKWYNIGLQLGVKPTELDCIRQNYPNTDDCFTEMLKVWLRDASIMNRTVKRLIMALQQETVGFGDVASSLEGATELSQPERILSLSVAPSSDSSVRVPVMISDSEVPVCSKFISSVQCQDDSQMEGQVGFKCPCRRCSIDQYFRNKCPGSLDPVSKSFPYLDVKHLSDNERSELYLKLLQETKDIIIEFSLFIGHMIDSFKERGIDPLDIKTSIKSIAPCELSTLSLLSPSSNLNCATSINGIIDTLLEKNYLSFFNYHIAEHLIKRHGTGVHVDADYCTLPMKRSCKSTKPTDQEHLSAYLIKFNKFCKKSVFEVPIGVFGPVPNIDEGEKLAFKVTNTLTENIRPSGQSSEVVPTTDSVSMGSSTLKTSASTLNLSLEETLVIQGKIADCLGLKSLWSLVFLGAAKGCVELNFSVPKIVMNKIKSHHNIFTNLESSGVHVLCGPPGKPKVTQMTEDVLTLQWTKPEYTGSQPLTHYYVYYRFDHRETWATETTEGAVESIKMQVKKLSQKGSLIIFKVKAVNIVESGIESEESDVLKLPS